MNINEYEHIKEYMTEEDDFLINIGEWVRFLWVNRRIIILTTFFFTVLGVGYALTLPKYFTAKATILPPQATDSKVAGILANLGGIASDLAGSSETMSKVYPDIAKSRSVLDSVLAYPYKNGTIKVELNKFYKLKNNIDERLIEILQKELVSASAAIKTNVVTVTVTSQDPVLSASIVNCILIQMESYFKYHFRSVASSQRMMIENRLVEVGDSLKTAENNLMRFREENRTTGLSPKLQTYEARLMREVEINNALYIELTRQHEISKISELQLKPVLNVLDHAVPPLKKSKPSRSKFVFMFFAVGFFSSVVWLRYTSTVGRFLKENITTNG